MKDETNKDGKAEGETKPEPKSSAREVVVSDSLKGEIEGAVNTTVAQIEKEREERSEKSGKGKTDVPPDKVQDGDEGGNTDGKEGEGNADEGKGGEPEPIADDLIERAVTAGMKISDAKSFKDAKALERVVGVMETRKAGESGAKDGDKAGDKGGDKSGGEKDPLDAIPDLDPSVYDEKVVAGFKAMKDIIRAQRDEIKATKGEGEARSKASWFDSQVAALGEAFVEHVGNGDRSKVVAGSPQAGKLATLEEKFGVLEAGYKAAKKDVSRDAVFKEAVSIVLGDVQAKADATIRSKELDSRRRQHISRPSGAKQSPTADPFEDVAAQLDRKFFNKK